MRIYLLAAVLVFALTTLCFVDFTDYNSSNAEVRRIATNSLNALIARNGTDLSTWPEVDLLNRTNALRALATTSGK